MDVTLIRIVLGLAICFAVHASPSYRDEEASNEALNPGLKGQEAVALALEGKLSSDEQELLEDLFNAANAERSSEERSSPELEEREEKAIYEDEESEEEKPIYEDEESEEKPIYEDEESEEKPIYEDEESEEEKQSYEEENPAVKGKEKVFAALEAKLTKEEQDLLDELFSGTDVGKRDSGMRDLRHLPRPGQCHERIACHPRGLTLACPVGSTIHIKDANYGRTRPDAQVCPYGRRHNDVTNCYASNSMSVVTKRCEGRTSCNVPSGTAVFGDPCYGTYKYLRVNYCCVRPKTKRYFADLACEGQVLKLECPARSVIHVLHANYGRTFPDSKVCPYGRKHKDNTSCIASRSNSVVTEACDGKSSCSVRASNDVFGEPCHGTYKYLGVIYSC